MKLYMIVALFLFSCNYSPVKKQPVENQKQDADSLPSKTIRMGLLFTLADAEKILGERAGLQDSSTTTNRAAITYQSSYIANTKDDQSKKTGNVYFLIRKFNEMDSCKREYTFIKTANEHNGIEALTN